MKQKDMEREIISDQMNPGMVISLQKKMYRVESVTKVTVARGTPFVKVSLRELSTGKFVEKNLKPVQTVKEVVLQEQGLEFLYMEDAKYLFLNIDTLDQVYVPKSIVGDIKNFLKEGVEVKASIYLDSVLNVELPQFLELMISEIEESGDASSSKIGVLETGAKVEIPPFIDVGDVIKVDTKTGEYIQRV